MTRTVTSAAALAALAMVCGPMVESSGDSPTVQAAALTTTPEPEGSTSADALAAVPAPWNGPLPIRPSRIAKVVPGSTSDSPAIKAAALGPPGVTGALGIPLMVLRAYHQAADTLAVEQPSCKLPWWLLAGIGHTESGHAESGRLTADGTTRGKILGPRLNGGIPGDAIITDTDHGSYDGDKVYDRAVGPMQFIPSTWQRWAADGNADGKTNPSNIFDATLAAGRYLCANDRDLATPAGLRSAVLSYNHSAPYLATVLAWGSAYRDGVSAVPDSPLPVVSDVTKVRPPRSSRPPKPAANPSKLPSAKPTATPSSASPSAVPSSSSPSGSTPGTGTTRPSGPSATATATPSETASCPSASPSPTGSGSGSGSAPESTTGQPLTGKPSSTGAATAGRPNGSATTGTSSASAAAASASAASGTATSSAATSGAGKGQPATARSYSSASATGSATVSPSPTSCTP